MSRRGLLLGERVRLPGNIWATRIVPGLFRDDRNRLHIDIPEFLAHHGFPDTPENRETCTQMAREVAREQFPGVPIHEA